MSKWPWPHRLKRIVSRLALLAAPQRLVDRRPHGVVRLGRRHDALGAGELHARLEARRLVVGARLDQAELLAGG